MTQSFGSTLRTRLLIMAGAVACFSTPALAQFPYFSRGGGSLICPTATYIPFMASANVATCGSGLLYNGFNLVTSGIVVPIIQDAAYSGPYVTFGSTVWSILNRSAATMFSVTGTSILLNILAGSGVQCLHIDNTGKVTGTGADCAAAPSSNQNIRTIGASFGSFQSGASALSAGATSCVPVYFSGTIKAVHLIANVSGSVTIDVQTVLHASWAGTASVSSITSSDTPALSSASAYTDTTLTGWTTTLAANTDVCFVMSAPTTIAGASITVEVAAN